MAEIARAKGVNVVEGVAEALPFSAEEGGSPSPRPYFETFPRSRDPSRSKRDMAKGLL